MDKIAQVKEAEVRGCVAAFVDAGLVKVAGQEGFDALCSAVCAKLPDYYVLEKVAQATDEVVAENAQPAKHEKTAAEKHDIAIKAALGDLLMQKTAGQIDNETFVKEASALMKNADLYWDGKKKPLSIDTQAPYPVADVNKPGVAKRVVDPEAAANLAARNEPGMKLTGNVPLIKDHAKAVALEKQKQNIAALLKNPKFLRAMKGAGAVGAGAGLVGAGVLGTKLYDKYAA